MKPPGKYRIGAFRPFVPDWVRFLVLLLTVLAFQLTGAVYLANLGEMVGSTALTAEDVRMLANADFCGMTMTFPLLLRIKFRFMSKDILRTCSAVMIVGNLVTMLSTSMPLLLGVSFLVGVFKIIGTFECMSSMQLVVTPKRDMSVFFCFVFLIVLGSIQLSGVIAGYVGETADWRHMHLAAMAAHAALILLHSCLLRPFRFIKKMPLYQIDWLSFWLWSAVVLLLDFVCEYGRRMDWLESEAIRAALTAALILAACAFYRLFTAKRPLIPPSLFSCKNVMMPVALYMGMQLMLAPFNVILPAFSSGVLKYGVLTNSSLNWAALAGVVLGVAVCYHWFVVCRGPFKPIVFCAFALLLLAGLRLHTLIASSIPIECFYLPYLLRGAGVAILFISLNIYMVTGTPFIHVMASLAVFGIVRTALGGTAANALCSQFLEYVVKGHRLLLGQTLDSVNPAAVALQHGVALGAAAQGHSAEQAATAAAATLYGKAQLQSLLISWKDVFGWWTVLGLSILLLLTTHRYLQSGARNLPSLRRMAVYLNPIRRAKTKAARQPARPETGLLKTL